MKIFIRKIWNLPYSVINILFVRVGKMSEIKIKYEYFCA